MLIVGSLTELAVVGLPMLTPSYPLMISKSGQVSNFRIVLIMPCITFFPLKESMPFLHQQNGLLDAMMLFSSTQMFGPAVVLRGSHLPACSSHLADLSALFQGITLPSYILFFEPFHPEEPHFLLVQICFWCMLSASILSLS
jgi:hypothetical protein